MSMRFAEHRQSRLLVPVLAALVSAALFGAATPASKALLQDLHPLQVAGLLYLGACLGVLPIALRGARSLWPTGRANRLRLLGTVICGGIVAPVFLLLAL